MLDWKTGITPSGNKVHLFLYTQLAAHSDLSHLTIGRTYSATCIDAFRWPLQSCFCSFQNYVPRLKEGGTCSNKLMSHTTTWWQSLWLFYMPNALWVSHFTCKTFLRLYLPSSHVWSRLCLLRHSSLLSGQESQSGGRGGGWVLWDGKEHVMLTWVVKPEHIWEKCPFIPSLAQFFFLFYRFLQLTVGISSLTWILILCKLKVHFTQIIQIFFQFLLVLFSYLNCFGFLFMVGNFSYCNFRHTRKFLICYQ